ncbi:MAG: hypothetical protein M3Q80_01910 [bacterium]|nr:hypothetical protein [bacterium]
MNKNILYILIIMIATGVIFAVASNRNDTATTTPVNSAENAPEGSIHNMTVPEGIAAARTALALKLHVAESKIIIMTAYEKDWSDSCLGLAGPDETCATVITPGYEVIMQAEGKTYVYRTNTAGTVVRFEK